MRRVALVIIVVIAILLQVGWLPALRPLGVVPNIMLGLVVLVGLEGTASTALLVAVAGGLAVDLASGANFGLWSAVLVLAALLTGMIRRAGMEVQGPLVAGVMVAAGTVVMTAVVLIGLVSTVSSWPAGTILGRLVVELVLNLILMVMLRPVVRWTVPSAPAELRIG